jgi:hypothetical protein
LNEAIASADAPRAIAFFKGFLQEQRASGLQEQRAGGAQTTRPGGGASMPSDKPIYTRAQVARLYDQHLRGAYAGREAEWARQEVDLIRAGREGRILGAVDVSGK